MQRTNAFVQSPFSMGIIFIHLLADQTKIIEILIGVLTVGRQVGVERAAEVNVITGIGDNAAGGSGTAKRDISGGT